MTLELNTAHPRVGINNQARLSLDRRTIDNALMIDGVSYDIDIDFSQGDAISHYQWAIPKIQAIWAQMAEQTLPDPRIPSNWQMECSYNSRLEKASVVVISSGVREDKTQDISFDAKKLKEALGETDQFISDYSNGGTVTAHKVMKYVNYHLMKPSYICDYIAPPLSSHLDPSVGSINSLFASTASQSSDSSLDSSLTGRSLVDSDSKLLPRRPPRPVVLSPPKDLASEEMDSQDDEFDSQEKLFSEEEEEKGLRTQTRNLLNFGRTHFPAPKNSLS